MPVIVTVLPFVNVAPADGEVIVEIGGVWSVDCVAAVRSDSSVADCTPMSASRLTVACCIAGSGGCWESPS